MPRLNACEIAVVSSCKPALIFSVGYINLKLAQNTTRSHSLKRKADMRVIVTTAGQKEAGFRVKGVCPLEKLKRGCPFHHYWDRTQESSDRLFALSQD